MLMLVPPHPLKTRHSNRVLASLWIPSMILVFNISLFSYIVIFIDVFFSTVTALFLSVAAVTLNFPLGKQ